jgi:hypothetical protein
VISTSLDIGLLSHLYHHLYLHPCPQQRVMVNLSSMLILPLHPQLRDVPAPLVCLSIQTFGQRLSIQTFGQHVQRFAYLNLPETELSSMSPRPCFYMVEVGPLAVTGIDTPLRHPQPLSNNNK